LDQDNLVYVVRHFMSDTECEQLIAVGEAAGFATAPISTSSGPVIATDIRNNTRVMFDRPELADRLWLRTRDLVPEGIEDRDALGLNERFRLYRYDPGERFAPHYDGAYRRNADEKSELSLMVYLNDGFEGGETRFYHEDHRLRLTVRPERGMALFFLHCQLHEGSPVRSGRKYVARTDVMYRQIRYTVAMGEPGHLAAINER
jgi:predicted 2-oxoglutarate/Fe(II)-dependent dioxygenase YbiX